MIQLNKRTFVIVQDKLLRFIQDKQQFDPHNGLFHLIN